MPQDNASRPILAVLALIGLTFAVFSIWPGIDLWVSGLAYDPTTGFWIDGLPASGLIRRVIWGLSIAMVLAAMIAFGWGFVSSRTAPNLHRRVWVFILLLYTLGPGLIVNVLLKAHWGRARPANILEFGGTAHFTPPIQITDQCARNCSFVSGEGSAAMALAVSILMILHHLGPRIAPATLRLGQVFAGTLVILGGAQRVATGRHFLSDAVIAILLVLLIAFVLIRLLKLPHVPPQNASGAAVDNPGDSPYTPPT